MEIEKYQMVWNAGENEGTLILLLMNGETVNQHIDSASEAMLMIDLLRNESPVIFDAKGGGVLSTGFEPVGEGEVASQKSDTEED